MISRSARPLWVLILLTLIGSCAPGTSAAPRPGKAFQTPNVDMWGYDPMPPGEEFVTTHTRIYNGSEDTVVLRRVRLRGPAGVGKVIQLRRAEVVPLGEPGATFKTYPPGFSGRDGCDLVEPFPLDGYEVGPGESVRLLLWFRVVASGRFEVEGPEITYQQRGVVRAETVTTGLKAKVRQGAPPMPGEDPHCYEDPRVVVLPTRS